MRHLLSNKKYLAEITGITDSLACILQEFIQQNESIIDYVQVLTKEGAILLVFRNIES